MMNASLDETAPDEAWSVLGQFVAIDGMVGSRGTACQHDESDKNLMPSRPHGFMQLWRFMRRRN